MIINKNIFNQVKSKITDMQHGFFKGRSTATNLLEFVNYSLYAMDRGSHIETLYTDFSKAFDKIDTQMLIFKLGKIGFDTQV